MKHGFFILCLLLTQVTFGQNCAVKNTSFHYNEVVDYTIYYYLAGFWVSAGEVSFKVDSATIDDKMYYHFNSYGSTLKKYDWIYKVRDYYESYASESTMKPIRFKREVNEGSTHIREDYAFDFDKKEAITSRQMNKKEAFVSDTIRLEKCSYDVMTMIYVARNLNYSDLKIGDKIPITLFLDNEVHDSHIEYLGKENLEIEGLGKFRCIKFAPLLIEGTIFNAGDGMTVYVTDDQNKVPLLIETPILVGSIKAKVSSMEGLKYPLTSKLND